MNQNLIIICIACFFCTQLTAQSVPGKTKQEEKNDSSIALKQTPYWTISFNLLGFAEPQAAIGASAAYRFSKRLELWNEISFLCQNIYKTSNNRNAAGIRYLLQPRYFIGQSKLFFIGAEFRLKRVSFDDVNTFINESIPDTLQHYNHRTLNTFIAAAIVFGGQWKLNNKGNMFIELISGVGGKERKVYFKNIPAGYKFFEIRPIDGPFVSKNNSGIGLPYLSFAVRLGWVL